MNYPGTPEDWAVSITQNLYASVFLLIIQTALLVVLRWLDRYLRNKNQKLVLYKDFFVFLGVSLFPALCLYLVARGDQSDRMTILILVLSFIPLACYAIRFLHTYWKLIALAKKAKALGIDDVILKPEISEYKGILESAVNQFEMMGVGAEKLTRDVEVFKNVVGRCGKEGRPVRLLLVHPDEAWVTKTAMRRELLEKEFKRKIAASLEKIKQIHAAGNHIEVRFYRQRPIFRLVFVDERMCYFGQYADQDEVYRTNQYESTGNPDIVIGASLEEAGRKLELYSALKNYFELMWKSCEKDSWDFESYIE